MSEFIHGDCMDYLKDYPDNYFDLAIADPPYGNSVIGGGVGSRGTTQGSEDGLLDT